MATFGFYGLDRLTKNNSSNWNSKIEGIFRPKKLWRLVTGIETKPTNVVFIVDWENRDNEVVGLHNLTILNPLLPHIDGLESTPVI